MSSATHEKKDLLLAWTKLCFVAAGLEPTEKEIHSYAATAANEIIEEGFAGFAEGNSVSQKRVAGGKPVPGFIAYLNRSVPAHEEGRLEAFDEIFQRFVDLTASVEAEGDTGVLANAAYNRSVNAANEILQGYFELRTEDFAQKLHDAFGNGSTPVDLSKVNAGKAMAGGSSSCAVSALALACITTAAAVTTVIVA